VFLRAHWNIARLACKRPASVFASLHRLSPSIKRIVETNDPFSQTTKLRTFSALRFIRLSFLQLRLMYFQVFPGLDRKLTLRLGPMTPHRRDIDNPSLPTIYFENAMGVSTFRLSIGAHNITISPSGSSAWITVGVESRPYPTNNKIRATHPAKESETHKQRRQNNSS